MLALTAYVTVGRAYDLWRGTQPIAIKAERRSAEAVIDLQRGAIVNPRTVGRRPTWIPRALADEAAPSPITLTIRVTFDSKPVVRAKAVASESSPEAHEIALPLPPWSDEGGMLQIDGGLVEGAGEETKLKVLAYHPDFGTGLAETTLGAAKKGGLIDIKLERGSLVTGRVVTADGKPIVGAFVQLSSVGWPDMDRTPQGVVCLQGLGALTKEDGTFTIPGIRFLNWPGEVYVQYRPSDPTAERAWRAGFDPVIRQETWWARAQIPAPGDDEPWPDTFSVGDIQLTEPRTPAIPVPRKPRQKAVSDISR